MFNGGFRWDGAFERRSEAEFDWEDREFEVLRWRLVWGFANLGEGLCQGDRAFAVCALWLCSVDDDMFIKTRRTGHQRARGSGEGRKDWMALHEPR